MPKKLTQEEVNARLLQKNVKILDKYTNIRSRYRFQCLIKDCDHIWITDAHSILIVNKGCAKCYGNNRLTNEEIDNKILIRKIKRLDNYVNSTTRIRWKCLLNNCNHIWIAKPYHILTDNSGCPKCTTTKQYLSEDVINNRLTDKAIKMIDSYQGIITKINFLCLNKNCGLIWKTTPNTILNAETGCPACCAGKNENLVWEILKTTFHDVKREVLIKNIISNESRKILLDFYLPRTKTIIEYNGDHHYKPIRFGNMTQDEAEKKFIKQQIRDKYVQKICDDNNINLIWIDGRKYRNSKLKLYLLDNLIPTLF